MNLTQMIDDAFAKYPPDIEALVVMRPVEMLQLRALLSIAHQLDRK